MQQSPQPPKPLAHASFVFFAILLPLAALGFELATHGCSEVLFDPIPSWPHAFLVASVPLAAILAERFARGAARPPARWVGRAVGFALGVSLAYAPLFAPVLPFAVFGILFFGLGLLPIAPIAAAIALLARSRRLAREHGVLPRDLWAPAVLALALVVALEVPGWLVAYGLAHEDVELLRAAAPRSLLLVAAQRGTRALNLTDHLDARWPFFEQNWRELTAERERNRALFYRATGEDAAALPAAARIGAQHAGLFWDPSFRSDGDSGELEGLSLEASRIDGRIYADPAVAYLEWTFVVRNQEPFSREAHARLALPPGAVVTRATLWVDGEEREAAFGPRGQVREAFERVVQARRDPLLVTSDRPGDATFRAFPVPAHGSMRFRVGITAPLALESAERGALRLPYVDERNFSIGAGLEDAVWIECERAPLEGPGGTASEPLARGGVALRGARGNDPGARVVVARSGAPSWRWPVADGGGTFFLEQELGPPAAAEATRWVVVVDGSRALAPHAAALADALAELPAERLAALIVAHDEPLVLLRPETPAAERVAALEGLRRARFAYGSDDRAGLEQGLSIAAQHGASVLWIHGPQPVALGSPDRLAQQLELRPELRLVAFALEGGAHPLRDALPARRLARGDAPGADLRAEIRSVLATGGTPGGAWTAARRRGTSGPAAGVLLDAGAPVAELLTRLWVSDEVARRLERDRWGGRDELSALAARFHVVTPVSGAVVLERRADYEAAQLETPAPSHGNGLAPVPEPTAGLLFGLGLALLAGVRRYAPGSSRR